MKASVLSGAGWENDSLEVRESLFGSSRREGPTRRIDVGDEKTLKPSHIAMVGGRDESVDKTSWSGRLQCGPSGNI